MYRQDGERGRSEVPRPRCGPPGGSRALRSWRQCAVVLLALAAFTCFGQSVAAYEFTADDIREVTEQGFGDRGNSYAWTMAYFKGKVFIGTNHNFACLVRSLQGTGSSGAISEVPVECVPSLVEEDLRGRIYTYDPATRAVELVYLSPTMKGLISDGTFADVAVDIGYRTMTVFHEPDGTEALYIGTFVSPDVVGGPPRILRSTDGRTFTTVPGSTVNNSDYVSYRSLTVYKDRLYVIALPAQSRTAALLEARDPVSGDFRVVNTPGFGDPVNIAAFELAVFKGYLYVGTATVEEGFQLLKTQAVGEPPYTFQPVLTKGAHRGVQNQNVVSLVPFRDHLYVGTGINFVALRQLGTVDPAPPELLRVSANGDWDLISGVERTTPDGFKTPLSGKGPGFGNPLVGYMWRMVEHDGVLYLSTMDFSMLAQYAPDEQLETMVARIEASDNARLKVLLEALDIREVADVISAVEGGYDLWATPDGVSWREVTRSGLGDGLSFGVRSFASTPTGLFLGTSNPFFGLRLYHAQTPGTDTDGDGFADVEDNCPLDWNFAQHDLDADGVGNECDRDSDNDCFLDEVDPDPLRTASNVPDTDRDGQSDQCDNDDDGDSVPDFQDNCRLVPNYGQTDSDGDGVGDACASASPGDSPGAPIPSDTAPGLCGAGFPLMVGPMLLGLMLMGGRQRYGPMPTLLRSYVHTRRRKGSAALPERGSE